MKSIFGTLTNKERVRRAAKAFTGYSADEKRTSLFDFLADAMHWCRINGHSFDEVLDTARMHFKIETRKKKE